MKHGRAFTVLLLCLWLSPAAGSEFDDYRIPESSRGQYNVSISGFGNRSSRNRTGSYDRSLYGFARLGGDFLLARDSEPLQWDVAASGAVNGDRRRSTSGRYGPRMFSPPGSIEWESARSSDQRLTESWWLGGGVRWYPAASRIGLHASGSVSGQEEQSWNRRDSETENTASGRVARSRSSQSSQQWVYREAAELQAGIGLGKVRDASPVFLTLLLEERLRRDGKLQRAPTPSCRQQLAELFSLRSAFSIVHVQPEKSFWAEVERLLREDGALAPDGLDAFAAQHLDEELAVARSAFVRRAGWFFGPALSARQFHELVRFDAASSGDFDDGVTQYSYDDRSARRTTSSTEALMAGGRAEYYRPFGSRLQLNLSISALSEVTGDEDLQVSGGVGIQRLVGERWFAEAYAFNSRSIGPDAFAPSSWNVRAGGAISYFLEDYCRAELSLDRSESAWEYAPPFPTRIHAVDLSARVTLSVGRGRLDAPGLLPPVRPLH